MNIAFEAGVTCTKSSIPSHEPLNTSTFPKDKEKEDKVIGTPSQGILKPITGKEKIPIREDIQDIKNSEGEKRGTLSWKQRFDIIFGTARGLAELHICLTNTIFKIKAWKLHETEMQEKLVDERLDRNDFKAEDVKKLIEIALACTQSPASSRPTMSEVLVMLSSDRSVEQKTLSRPSFLDPERDYRTVPFLLDHQRLMPLLL
ncbi:Uncharacterized protein Fot_25836 [Forsythia ovata]|uniref:Uncharacterized protein n=1 Tax=Forsythia ovata TaxID=205694 RepID=A0ABD1UBB2_9LAMI